MEDHFLKFDALIRELENTGMKIDETDKVCHLLLTMDAKYELEITAIETMNAEMTVNFVKSRLLDAELKVCSKQEDNNDNNVTFFSGEFYKCKKKSQGSRLLVKIQFVREEEVEVDSTEGNHMEDSLTKLIKQMQLKKYHL